MISFVLQDFRRFDLEMKNGPRDDAAMAEGRRLFELVQLDIWDSLRSALLLPEEGPSSRASLKKKIDRKNKRFGKLIKANLVFLLEEDSDEDSEGESDGGSEDGGGEDCSQANYDAVTATLAALEATVKASFPSKPPQIVADVVTLYEHACAIEAPFNEVPARFSA